VATLEVVAGLKETRRVAASWSLAFAPRSFLSGFCGIGADGALTGDCCCGCCCCCCCCCEGRKSARGGVFFSALSSSSSSSSRSERAMASSFVNPPDGRGGCVSLGVCVFPPSKQMAVSTVDPMDIRPDDDRILRLRVGVEGFIAEAATGNTSSLSSSEDKRSIVTPDVALAQL
jgi:hypothetical protein